MTVTSLLLLFITVCTVRGGGGREQQPFLVQTAVACATTKDCAAHYNNDWCHRGQVCLQTRCWVVPDYPCARTAWCDEREKRCIRRNCSSWRDCDDGVFCNGVEVCVAGQCEVDPNFDCTQGGAICNEATHTCSQSLAVSAERARIKPQQWHATVNTSAPTANATAPTVPVGEISTTTLIWVVVAFSSFLFLVLMFWLFQQASWRRPQTIMVDRDARNGNRVFVPETYY